MYTGTTVLWKYNIFSLNFNIFYLLVCIYTMPTQFNLRVIGSKSAFLWYISRVCLAYTIDCVAAQKLYVFMQPRPVLDRQEHVLHRSKCSNLMLTLRSCFSNKFLTSGDKYLNFTRNYFKLNSLSDNITFVYVNCVIGIGHEHLTNYLYNISYLVLLLWIRYSHTIFYTIL